MDSDPRSLSFGHSTVWVMRWSQGKGVAMTRAKGDALFSAPLPVNRHLITRSVTDLGDEHEERVFSSVDMDRWAAEFLASVESLFDPASAPGIAGFADQDTRPPVATDTATGTGKPAVPATPVPQPVYDTLAQSKAALAQTIKSTLDWIYQGDYQHKTPEETRKLGEVLGAAEESLLQAMLSKLENDYNTAVVGQIPVEVSLHGRIEPWDGPDRPAPRLFGPIGTTGVDGASEIKKLPYNLSNSKLPIRNRGDQPEWLNFTVQARNPSVQPFFKAHLEFSANAVEHKIHSDDARNGYVPSSWLSFVLPNDRDKGDPRPNTLTAALGLKGEDRDHPDSVAETIIPVPLRSFPPNAKLMRQTATQTPLDTGSPPRIEDVLKWDYHVEVEPPRAAQDRLVLQVVFNEEVGVPQTESDATQGTCIDDVHGRLFDAFARYRFALTQLKADTALADRDTVVKLNGLIASVAEAWGPVAAAQQAERIKRSDAPAARAVVPDAVHEILEFEILGFEILGFEIWEFEIIVATPADGLQTVTLVQLSAGAVQWPLLDGYDGPLPGKAEAQRVYRSRTLLNALPDAVAATATGSPTAAATAPKGAQSYRFVWEKLYVLQYQSAHTGGYILRNERLAPEDAYSAAKPNHDDWNTNSAFVYRSELVRFSAPVVPLISADAVAYIADPNREAAIAGMFDQFRQSASAHPARDLQLEIQVNYSFELMARDGAGLRTSVPVFLMQTTIGDTTALPTDGQNGEQMFADDATAASAIEQQIAAWETQHLGPGQNDKPAWDFACTIFATRIVRHHRLLPLVRIGRVEIRKPG
ncbi:hypothetical protein [Candidatus Accumulibacter sp. ACC007]|uniref:hypothetical protein n=1 Tax=Candidatus Accumulibacter sp. ACC007 TaxID=2823333 RepID=UPI0025BBDC70|nr:hypothetical protein [Candidatus Accumulibacter sp. ACC007]